MRDAKAVDIKIFCLRDLTLFWLHSLHFMSDFVIFFATKRYCRSCLHGMQLIIFYA